jgi:hypothetical protein
MAMEKTVGAGLDDALRKYEACLNTLRVTCQCKTCQSSLTGFDFTNTDDEAADAGDSDSSPHNVDSSTIDIWDPDVFCLVILAETIIGLSRSLANTHVAKDLFPTRVGFDLAYGEQLNLRRSAHFGKTDILEFGPIVFLLNSTVWRSNATPRQYN